MNPNKIFPILCQDDFFDNPDEIREYALSLDYKSDENGHWPGVRTRPLHKAGVSVLTSKRKRWRGGFESPLVGHSTTLPQGVRGGGMRPAFGSGPRGRV